MPACIVAPEVSFEDEPSLALTPGERTVLRGRSGEEQLLELMVRVPEGLAPVRLRVESNGESRPQWCVAGGDATEAEWRRLGPIPVDAGESSVEIVSEAAEGGSWPARVEPFHIAKLTLGGQPLDCATIAAAQLGGEEPLEASSAEALQPDLFTSFEESGALYFLEYIPWIYNRRIVWGAPVEQSGARVLSGTHSCYFYEDFFGTSALETQELAVPPNSGKATIGGWIYAGIGGLEIEAHARVDGGADQQTAWQIKNEEVGRWVYRYFTVSVPAGASTYYGWIRLKSKQPISANHFWLDDFLVDFGPRVEAPLEEVVFGDIGANLYGLDAAQGTQDWRYNAGAGMIGSAPLIIEGVAYIGTTSGLLSAVDVGTGNKKWSVSVPAGIQAVPEVSGSLLLVMADDGVLRAHSRLDGSTEWELDVLRLRPGTHVSIGGIALSEGVLCIATEEGICAVSMAERDVLWHEQAELDFSYPPDAGEGAVYCGGSDDVLYALELADGSVRWSFDSGAPLHSSPQLVGGVVLSGDDDGHLRGLEAATGEVVFTLGFPAQQVRSFLFDAGNLYVVGNSVLWSIYCYSLVGDQWQWASVWHASVANGAQADPVVLAEQVILTASDSHVYSFNRFTGALCWSYAPARVAFAGAAVTSQAPALDVSRRFDRCCWLGSHNAYANSAEGWWYAQQSGRIVSQLDVGVRMLMLDTWACNVDGSQQVVYAHGGCEFSRLILPFTSYVRFEDSLAEIAAWLAANPAEIVTIVLEQHVQSKAMLQGAISGSGIEPLIFWADRPNQGNAGTWNVATQGWPALSWMVAANKRLVIFSDQGGDPKNRIDDGLPYTWTWCVENEYNNASMNGQCNARPQSAEISDPEVALFIQNYNTTLSLHSYNDFMDVNDAERILGFVNGCQGLRGRLPNFLAVDWQEFGTKGGPIRAVEEINARWARLPRPRSRAQESVGTR